MTGAVIASFAPPNSMQTVITSACNGNPTVTTTSYPGLNGPVVGPDGTVYAATAPSVQTTTYNGQCGFQTTNVQTLSLISLAANGTTAVTPFHTITADGNSSNWAFLSAGPGVIPDGQGGALVAWYISGGTSSNPNPSYHITDVSSSGTTDQTYSAFSQPVAEIVLGDSGSGLAYATDFRSVVAFSISSGSGSPWTYTPSSVYDSTQILAATQGGGLNILDTNSSASPTTYSIIPVNSSGSPGSPIPTYQGSSYSWDGQLVATPGSGALDAVQAPLALFAENFWSTPAGDPAENDAAGATCACDFETTDPNPPPPPQVCSICALPAPTGTQPTCTSVSGNQSTYLLLVGDPGLNDHNVGNAFNLAAQTEMNLLQEQGHLVIACRVPTVDYAVTALTTQGLIDGGVIYFGHSGLLGYSDNSGNIVAVSTGVYPGQNPPDPPNYRPNIDTTTVNSLAAVQTGNAGSNSLGGNAELVINGCNAALKVQDFLSNEYIAIAQPIANNLMRGVEAYKDGVYFSQYDAEHDQYRTGKDRFAPAVLPVYMVPEGTPRHKPAPIPFTPQ